MFLSCFSGASQQYGFVDNATWERCAQEEGYGCVALATEEPGQPFQLYHL